MSLPPRPQPPSPIRQQYNHSPSTRRPRPQDLEASAYYPTDPATGTRHTPLRKSPSRRDYGGKLEGPQSPGTPVNDREPLTAGGVPGGSDLGRKKSLIKPERGRINRDHPNYYYRQHAQAQGMNVIPSTTGNDLVVEDGAEVDTTSSDSTTLKSLTRPDPREPGDGNSPPRRVTKRGHGATPAGVDTVNRPRVQRKLTRKDNKRLAAEEKRRDEETIRPPSLWDVYCLIITFWCPGAILKCFGKPSKAQQRAWREKMGLLSIILLIGAFVGFLTFGFTAAVCGKPGLRLKVNHVDTGYMIFHGHAYQLSESEHPVALGIPAGSNVLYDLPEKFGGKDGSFLFQNVNGACKGLITLSPDSDVPTNDNGDLAWYFPCMAFNQDGSSKPNKTIPFDQLGYSCHTTASGRQHFYSLRQQGEVYFTWDDINNSSRNLMVYSGNVLDLNLLEWFNGSQVTVPAQFEDLRLNPKVRGVDVTHAFQNKRDKQVAKCLSEIIRVGSIDTETVGCIASKVVLYVSLVFILSIVLVKFWLALFFSWFWSRRYATPKTRGAASSADRSQQIEDWSDDIYRPPPKLVDANGNGAGDRSSKRGSSLFPTTSRFTSPYATERATKQRVLPTTMASQTSTTRLLPPGPMYKHGNGSQGSLSGGDPGTGESRTSLMLSGQEARLSGIISEAEGPGPSGFIHEAVVPQPPPDWQPFGYPLAHAICLVTAYSEGELAIRTTLDSIATTDYPNSHKLILVICDGMIKGKGEETTTPEITLGMMKDQSVHRDDVQAFSYVAVASGSKRHNMAKVFAGFYDYGEHSLIPAEKQQRIPMIVVVKCGTPDEAGSNKRGNRGKRDSQIILMSFLQKVMFDERMTELEFEMFNGIWKVTGISPDFYEVVLMVDADTKVFPDSLTFMVSAMVQDPEIMGLCGETKIANKGESWVTMIQVFEYFISHHLSKSFESVFGGVTCLPGCFSMYRIKAPKGGQNYWVPILANPDVVEHYSENVVDTLHKKNLLLLGEDRYLSTLMLKTFPKRKQVFVPQAVCKTTVPAQFRVLLSQRRRWINSTVHNLMELVLVRDLCGTFCFSMQFVVGIELVGTLVLPAAISFTVYVIIISIIRKPVQVIPLVLLALILGLPAVLIVMTAHRWSYVIWMSIYLLSLPIWNFVFPVYAYWKFDDFSWGETRKTAGEKTKMGGIEYEGEFDSSKITMKRWGDFEKAEILASRVFKPLEEGVSKSPASTIVIYERRFRLLLKEATASGHVHSLPQIVVSGE
ncbi:Chitin synthase 4 [Glutinoglossum americanum]|uniref:chitin synthase n=1 Tax=Glutinoglossum americanum TaxID=1670608 RepID=A0A9P8I2Q0_9PEZI|nr:Chitin synthase 4 [Glutinoglossum americanum]